MNSASSLITRLRLRIASHPSTDLECQPPTKPGMVLTAETISKAEADLGFALPKILREIYLEVADGGFGPGWGILAMESVLEFDRYCRNGWEDGRPPIGWPDKMIRFCEWGCNIWSGVDCSSMDAAIVRFDPDRETDQIADHFVLECHSLESWLTSWLDGALSCQVAPNG